MSNQLLKVAILNRLHSAHNTLQPWESSEGEQYQQPYQPISTWADDQFPFGRKTPISQEWKWVQACGDPRASVNLVSHGDCMVCGKSFDTIREEITFNFLEQTHLDGES